MTTNVRAYGRRPSLLTGLTLLGVALALVAGSVPAPATVPATTAGEKHVHDASHVHDDAVLTVDGGSHADTRSHGGADCEQWLSGAPGEPASCAHADEAPPGVDVTEAVTTKEAVGREGAVEAAAEAANELGVPTAATPGSSSTVPCDGDGRSGHRVQAMYVVESDDPNRFAGLLPSMKTWASGAAAVVNRSAALTGGVRDLRFVHAPGASDCEPVVLNVTVPPGSNTTFQGTVNAVRSAGYADPARKYLMWVDAAVLCGIANQYLDDRPGQTNANNGTYPQYSRVDQACWGNAYSVEAHELVHNLGGVQRSAPNSTAAGHCTDESDRMCYVDGGGVVMRQVCPSTQENLLDCNGDDYFSTLPVAGSYLDNRWNSADSRFLIGGGDGTDGGQAGTPTRLGMSVQVNNPAVPGLPTQAGAELQLPAGRTATVSWQVSRSDCVLGAPAEVQTTVTCPAATTAAVTLTATARSSTGEVVTVRSPVTFVVTPKRPVQVTAAVDGTTGTWDGCPGVSPVTGTVVDTASGAPVLGVTVDLLRRASAVATTTSSLGSGRTTVDGVARLKPALLNGQVVSARSRAVGPYLLTSTTADVLVRTPASCATSVTLLPSATTAWAGDRVTFSGTATRTTPAGASFALAAGSITLVQTPVGAATPVTLWRGSVGAGGTWTAPVVVTDSGPVTAKLSAGSGWTASQSPPVTVTTRETTTRLSTVADLSAVPYGSTVTLSGTLQRDADGTLTPVAGRSVAVTIVPVGATRPTALARATTTATGTWSTSFKATVSGSVTAAFAAVTGQPAAVATVGDLQVASWATTTSATATPTTVSQAGPVTVTGSVTRSSGATTGPAVATTVSVVLQPPDGAAVVLGSVRTRADGTFSTVVRPTEQGTLTAGVTRVAGHEDSTSAGTPLTVAASATAVASTRTPKVGTAFTVSTSVRPAQAAGVVLERQLGSGAWTTVGTATTSTAGAYRFTVVPTTTGVQGYRVQVAATGRTAAVTSPTATVTAAP